jgi:aspartate aminotransferase-like enzyme
MISYRIPLVPGPVSIPPEVLEAYNFDYASPDLEEDFFRLYSECEFGLQQLLSTRNDVAILSGEGMLALWSALKSSILPGDRVLAIATGVFGYGIADMARQIGAEVEVVSFKYDEVLDADLVAEVAQEFLPHMITAVHCETPSGIMNPLDQVGEIAREVEALFYVDFVASAGGAPVLVDEWNIDLGLMGSQKALSLMPDLSMVSISEQAWEKVNRVGYVGYDALLPFKTAVGNRYMPYTCNWHALAGLKVALDDLFAEGLECVYDRHLAVMLACHTRLEGMGVRLYPADRATAAPTVTAAYVPEGWVWQRLNERLRADGMALGGSYGPLSGVVFRVGHMGSQARLELVHRGMDVLEHVLQQR